MPLNIFKPLRSYLFLTTIAVVLFLGWSRRDDNYLSAETGIGYLLGIIGASLMILLLLYPLSKHMPLLTRLMPIRYWFGVHMIFGILGPTMILFHSNFHLGSTNSSIALICMLLVAGSGLIGRYIYTHIHHGLYGSRITLKELKLELENNHSQLLGQYDLDKSISEDLSNMEVKAMQPYRNLLASLSQISYLALNAGHLTKTIAKQVKRHHAELNNHDKHNSSSIVRAINTYTNTLRRIAAFTLYERLFSLWHILHLPLFIMMIFTSIIHIFAVHMY